AGLFLGSFIVGPTVLIAVIGSVIHRCAHGRRAWVAARDGIVAAAVVQLLLTVHILYSIATSRHSTAALAIINVPLIGLPLSALIFLVTWPAFLWWRCHQTESLSADRGPGATGSLARPKSRIPVLRIFSLLAAIGSSLAAGGVFYSG